MHLYVLLFLRCFVFVVADIEAQCLHVGPDPYCVFSMLTLL